MIWIQSNIIIQTLVINLMQKMQSYWRRDRLPTPVFLGFPCDSAGKESTCSAGDLGSIPGLGKSPGEQNSYLLQYSGLENSVDCIVQFSSVQSLSHVWLFVTPWTIAHQAPQSLGFSRQEYCSGLPFPTPEDLPNPGIEPRSPTLQADSLPAESQGKPE